MIEKGKKTTNIKKKNRNYIKGCELKDREVAELAGSLKHKQVEKKGRKGKG